MLASCSTGQGPALRAALEQGVFLAKPNRREAAELIGRSVGSFDDAREANDRLLAMQATAVAVTTIGELEACAPPSTDTSKSIPRRCPGKP